MQSTSANVLDSPCSLLHCSCEFERMNRRMPASDASRKICPAAQHPVIARLQVSSESPEVKQLNINHADPNDKCTMKSVCDEVHSVCCDSEIISSIPKPELVDESEKLLCRICYQTLLRNKPGEKQSQKFALKHLPSSNV